jgi:hypothetical protein
MDVNCSENVTVARLEQLLNTLLPMVVSVFGMVNEGSKVQLEKAEEPIVVSCEFSGNNTSVSFLQE